MERESKFGLSMQELIDPLTFYAVLFPVEWHVQLARKVGMDGTEFFPTRISNYQVRKELISPSVKENILSAHQSFRGERGLHDILKNKTWKRRMIATASLLALPQKDSSIKTLQKLQNWIGREIPIVAYPDSEPGPAVLYSEFKPGLLLFSLKNRIFQPSAEHLKIWGLSRPETIQEYLDYFGWSGLCLDLFHIRERNIELQTPNWKEYLPALLPFTKEIHVAAGRIDSPQTEIDTKAELADLYTGGGRTEISEMLEFIGKSGWKGLVITETPVLAIKDIAMIKRPFVTPKELISIHKKITETVREILKT